MDYKNNMKSTNLDNVVYFLLCIYVLLSCAEDFGAKYFLRAAFAVGIIRLLIKFPKVKIAVKHFYFIGAFLMALLVTAFFNGVGYNYYESIRMIRSDYLLTMLPMLLIVFFIRTDGQVKMIFLCLMISFSIANIFGIRDFFQGITRVGGVSGGIMQLGGILILLMPTVFLLFSDEFFMPQYRKVFLFVLLLGFPVVFFNATRIVWIALAATMTIAIFMSAGKFKIKTAAYVALLAILFLGICNSLPSTKARLDVMFDKSYQSNSERILMWNSAWNMFVDHPLFGVGIGNYKEQYFGKYISPLAKEETVHAHSNFMQLLATSGILGTGAYISMFGYFLYESFEKWRRKRTLAPILFFCASVGFLIHGLTDYNIGFIGVVAKIYWMLLGTYLVLDKSIVVENR